jgi:predicted phage terminase large subunit-like protein
VERGEIDRLMLLMPPRHGKSELASKSMPAWSIGRKPWRQFISASASVELARDWGREVRNIVMSDAYQAVYPTRLQEDSKAAGKWNTQEGGCYYAVGVGGSPLGRGADIFLIDDPFGSMEDARSPVIREKVWNWYTGTVYNRLQSDGAVIVINQRMHEDDLSGRLIEQIKAGKDHWTIVELPALAIDHDRDGNKIIDPLDRRAGEALWPEEYDVKRIERRRENTLARYFNAMYQQQPVPDEGELFAPDKITLRDHTGDIFNRVRGWDLSGTIEGDWTCGVLIGRTKTGKFVVIDVKRLRGTPDKVMAAIVETARGDTRLARISLPEDPGQAGLFQAQAMMRALAGYTVVTSKETGDKETRAGPYAVQVNNGHVEMIEAEWNAAYREELRAFPYGKHDDQVADSDEAGHAFQ